MAQKHNRVRYHIPCMVQVQDGEASLQVHAAHPIGGRLVEGSKGQRKPFGHGFKGSTKAPLSMGFGESEVSPSVLIRLNAGEAP